MGKCTDADLAALNESGPLLRFAAEHVKNLDPDLPLAIAEAHAAAANGSWDAKISQRFWSAFAKLCDLIQPVTMDCLSAAEPTIAPPRWLAFLGPEKKSIAERSSARYLWVLLLLLAIIVPVQLYVWTCSNLSKKIDELLTAEKVKYTAYVDEYTKINTALQAATPATVQVLTAANQLKFNADSAAIHDDLDRIYEEMRFLAIVSSLFLQKDEITVAMERPSPGDDLTIPDLYNGVVRRMSFMQGEIVHLEEKANLIVGVLGVYILPILFGTVGAVAYVIRTISEQIRTTTFATNSPTRHIMRAALGGMAGLVVGLFGDLSSKLSLSPLAIAFLAGYGVEAVFSMFDGLIAKFKEGKAGA